MNNTNQDPKTMFYERIQNAKKYPIEDAFLKLYGTRVPTNRMIVCLSPSHEDNTPSAYIYDDHIYCFGCRMRSDIIDLVRIKQSCNFIEALNFIETEFLDVTSVVAQAPLPKDICFFYGKPDKQALFNQWSTLESICALLEKYTNEIINKHNIPSKYIDYFDNRSIDLQFLITRGLMDRDVLFLDNADSLGKRVMDALKNNFVEPVHQKNTSLYAYGDQLCWINNNTYNLLIPVWRVGKWGEDVDDEIEIYPTAIRIRNTNCVNNGFPKEVLMAVRRGNAASFPSYGFMGMNLAFQLYEGVVDGCNGLTIFLAEGATDFLAAQELVFKYYILGLENLKNVIVLGVGGVNNASCTENIQMIRKCAHLIVAFDNDKAGDYASTQMLATAEQAGIKKSSRYVLPAGIKDLNDLLISIKSEK